MKFRITYFLFFLIFFGMSCQTYYERTIEFQKQVQKGDLAEAEKILNDDEDDRTGKNALLYYFNSGWLNWMQNQNQESIKDFNKAEILIEDYQKNYGLEAAALLTNPNVKPYRPEDHEIVMVNYFNGLNYMFINDWEGALVECRRINMKLNSLNNKYDSKNKYDKDAFAHLVMGMLYEANGKVNDAFIAYRNAYNVYEEDYSKEFGIGAPEQLKRDLLRTAYLNGFSEELYFYEKEFGMKYEHDASEGGYLVFLWHTGLGPVKAEWSINFVKGPGGSSGTYVFVNEELGLSFEVHGNTANEKKGFSEMSFLRVAFPKYVERMPYYNQGRLKVNGKSYTLELTQDINKIAFKTLHDRMLRELGMAIARLATKKAIELAAREANEDVGTAVAIVNFFTEKADTRHWQTLPYAIYYSRVKLPAGQHEITLDVQGTGGSAQEKFTVTIADGKTTFFPFHSMQAFPPRNR